MIESVASLRVVNLNRLRLLGSGLGKQKWIPISHCESTDLYGRRHMTLVSSGTLMVMAPTQPFKPRAPKKTEGDAQRSRNRTSETRSTKASYGTVKEDSTERKDQRCSQEKRKRKKHGVASGLENGEVNAGGVSSCDDSDSDLDLEKPLYPIGDYLHHRKDLVAQMFHSLRKNTLVKMIPPILREKSMQELQELCLFEINGLSRSRVRSIVAAQEFLCSSETDDSEDPLSEDIVERRSSSVQDTSGLLGTMVETKVPQLDLDEQRPPVSRPDDTGGSAPPSSQSDGFCIHSVQPLEMELVELELRAQALRAMMAALDEDCTVTTKSSISPRTPDFVEKTSSLKDEIPPKPIDRRRKKRNKPDKELLEIHVDESELEEFK